MEKDSNITSEENSKKLADKLSELQGNNVTTNKKLLLLDVPAKKPDTHRPKKSRSLNTSRKTSPAVSRISSPSASIKSVKPSPSSSRKSSLGQVSSLQSGLQSTSDLEGFKKKSSKDDSKAKHNELVKMGLMSEALSKKHMKDYILNELEVLYEELDINGNDFLQAEEILCAFHSFGFCDVTHEECVHICEEFSRQKGIEMCTVQDFKYNMFDTMKGGTTDEHLQMVFNIMDHNNQGVVAASGLIRMFHKFGLVLEPTEIYEYIDEIGTRDRGVFDFHQFKAYCNKIDGFNKLKKQFPSLNVQDTVTEEAEEEEEEEEKDGKRLEEDRLSSNFLSDDEGETEGKVDDNDV